MIRPAPPALSVEDRERAAERARMLCPWEETTA
jgi:hypothetical protein